MYKNVNENVENVAVNPEVEATNEKKGNGKDFFIGMACGAAIVGSVYGIFRATKRIITKVRLKKELKKKIEDEIVDEIFSDEDVEVVDNTNE